MASTFCQTALGTRDRNWLWQKTERKRVELSPNLTAESGPRLRVLAFRSMRVAEASLRSRRRYFLGGKEKIRRRAAFKKINRRQLRKLQKQLTRVFNFVSGAANFLFCIKGFVIYHAEATSRLPYTWKPQTGEAGGGEKKGGRAHVLRLTKPPLSPCPFRRVPRIPLLTFEN